jgi:hypothetical protein
MVYGLWSMVTGSTGPMTREHVTLENVALDTETHNRLCSSAPIVYWSTQPKPENESAEIAVERRGFEHNLESVAEGK